MCQQSKIDCPSQWVQALLNPAEKGLNRRKGKVRDNFLSLPVFIQGHQSSVLRMQLVSLVFLVLHSLNLDWNYTNKLVGLQFLGRPSWDFSASIITWTSFLLTSLLSSDPVPLETLSTITMNSSTGWTFKTSRFIRWSYHLIPSTSSLIDQGHQLQWSKIFANCAIAVLPMACSQLMTKSG